MSSPEPRTLHRSYLYAPGSNPAVMQKALRSGADAVILDLEDAVAPAAKLTARAAVAEALTTASGPDIHVRINTSDSGYDTADLDAIVQPALSGIRLPKAERASHIVELAAGLDALERDRGLAAGSIRLYPIIESARGMGALAALAAASPRVARFSFGASDLLADLRITGESPLSTLALRTELVLRSRIAEIGPPIDSVHTRLSDDEGLLESTRFAASLGFFGRSVIHPSQLEAVHSVYTPSSTALAEAAEIVAAAADAATRGIGALQIEGRFVDAATVARARVVLDQGGPQHD